MPWWIRSVYGRRAGGQGTWPAAPRNPDVDAHPSITLPTGGRKVGISAPDGAAAAAAAPCRQD